MKLMNRKMEQTLNEEGVLKKEPANWLAAADKWDHGQLILTTKRILFIGDFERVLLKPLYFPHSRDYLCDNPIRHIVC